jgi:hypothetical protein
MTIVLIILIVVAAVVALVALALGPVLNKRGDAAVARVKEALGPDRVELIEPKANGFGTEPASAGGLRAMGCLGLSDTKLMFVKWAPQEEFTIDRSAITSVTTSADDLTGVQKAMVMVTYTTADGGSATASWRLPDLVEWLIALGYDFGPDGPPELAHDQDDDEES